MSIRLQQGEAIRREAMVVGAKSTIATDLSKCDARFEITFDPLDEVLDEINTLIEVQLTLQDATQGFLYNTWNRELTSPDTK